VVASASDGTTQPTEAKMIATELRSDEAGGLVRERAGEELPT
jgi:hypothetical protein